MSDDKKCRHAKLHFGSGGWYIFCDECPAVWTPETDEHYDACVTNEVTDADYRTEEKKA